MFVPKVCRKQACSSSSNAISSRKCQTVALSVILLAMFIDFTESCRGGNLITTGVTAAEKYEILQAHNQLRSQVAQGQVPNQPGAQNMQEMVWDDELAAKAQQWAGQCTFEHDPSRYLDRFTMGQNLAIIWSTVPLRDDEGSFSSRIQNWFNEVQKYAWGARWSPATGHYSQLVWGETNLIGCGFAYYKDYRRYNKLYVCNYGPGGNVIGSQPYAVGTPSCSSYGMYPSSRYSGLCINTQTVYTPQNNLITQNTYTFKSERVNPTTYQTYRTNNNYQTPYSTGYSIKTPSIQPQLTYSQNSAVQTYQQALQAYQSPHSSYADAQRSYQLALEAYAAAYSKPKRQPKQISYYRQPARSSYDWSSLYRH